MPEIALNLIDLAEPNNGRQRVDMDHVHRLAHEIETVGLLHPIALEKHGPRYRVIAGNHRLLAFQHLHRETIPATIIDTTADAVVQLRCSENMTRNQLTPYEEAVNLGRLLGVTDGGTTALATRLHRSTEWIEDRLEILNWPEDLQRAIHEKTISLGAAKSLARITPVEAQNHYIRQAVTHGCSAQTARLWYNETLRDNQPPPTPLEISNVGGMAEFRTKTDVLCYGCNSYAELDETRSVRFCRECLNQLNEAHEQAARMSREQEAKESAARAV